MQTGRTPPYFTHNRILTWEWLMPSPPIAFAPRSFQLFSSICPTHSPPQHFLPSFGHIIARVQNAALVLLQCILPREKKEIQIKDWSKTKKNNNNKKKIILTALLGLLPHTIRGLATKRAWEIKITILAAALGVTSVALSQITARARSTKQNEKKTKTETPSEMTVLCLSRRRLVPRSQKGPGWRSPESSVYRI